MYTDKDKYCNKIFGGILHKRILCLRPKTGGFCQGDSGKSDTIRVVSKTAVI